MMLTDRGFRSLVLGGLIAVVLGCGGAPTISKPENPAPLPDPKERVSGRNSPDGGATTTINMERRNQP